jgi:MtN3 and saliva related transmembrane protein
MDYPTISRLAVIAASFLITMGLYQQAYKIWKTRSVRDFVAVVIAAVLVNELAWLNYGMMLGEWPIILVTALNLIPAAAICMGYIRFRRNDENTQA